MSAEGLKCYRFSTEAQWNACLFDHADRDSRRAHKSIRPFASYVRPGVLYESRGAHAPAVTRAGEILWRDDDCALYHLSACDSAPDTGAAPCAIARASRIVAASSGLWVISDPPEGLQRFEEDGLTRLLSVDVQGARVIDIANGGQNTVLALVEHEGVLQSVRVDHRGRVVETIEFKGISQAEAFVFLRRSRRFVVLAGDRRPRLSWFSAEGGPAVFSLAIAAMRPCFTAHVLGSDSNDKVFLAGADGDEFGGGSYIVIFDAAGNSLGDVHLDLLDAPVTGLAASRDNLLVTGQRGLLRFEIAEVVPEDVAQLQCSVVTPLLFSPDREVRRRWLRAEATVSLPEGSMLEISWAATDDAATRDRLNAIVTDSSIPASQRVAMFLHEDLQRGRAVYRGAAGSEALSPKTFSAKLFDVGERYLWVCITLTASTGARLPLLTELAVFYPGRTLMEDLPAIYQREVERPNSFLRSLVGVLEATTQGLDARIRSMGGQIHPATAQEPWLDFIARWLGVPWDDALGPQQKKAILTRAPDLAKGRGTRVGLEALLESLIPGMPRRFRVTDLTADFGFALVGGESCRGSTLPAMLGGRTRWSPELDLNAVVGYMRLPCAGQLDDGAGQLSGKVRIDVAATAAERIAWEPWLSALIAEMVPFAATVEIRWVAAQSLHTNRLDGTLTLESAPMPHLGTDAITGVARLPERGARLSAAGPTIGTRLG